MENKFIFADRHGLICRIKSSNKDVPKPTETVRVRTNSVTETSNDRQSFGSSHSTDNALSASLENLTHIAYNEIKKNESFFNGLFYDNSNGLHHKKSVTILEPNGHKVSPVKLIKKQKAIDGNKKIMESHLKTETFLDLSSSGLSLLSRSISKLIHLTQLYIYDNKITKLPKEIGNLVNLKELWMQENNISYLPIEMKNCKLLQHLDIRHNHLGDDSLMILTHFSNLKLLLITHNKFTRLDGIGRLKKLETLSVKSNKLEGALTRSIGKLQCIISLDLSKNRIVSIPNELGYCIKLKRLNLAYNKIIELPSSIGNLKELEFFGIKYNQLENLPSSISECVLLKELNVESNVIGELPESVLQKLHQMTRLTISHNKFTHLPKSHANDFLELQKINAEYNNISGITGALINAKNLKILNLCYNNLSDLQSSDIRDLIILVDLNLAFNHLSQLPKDLSHLTHLESLDLTNNLLTTTPEEIGELKNLKYLNLESNLLTSLPEEFGRLEKLKHLNISSNRLIIFPMCLLKLKNLEMLNLSENLISELPKAINQLDKLTHLFLKDNIKLNNLPVSLAGMKNLNFLSLNGCPLKDIPAEYNRSPITVIAYLRALEIGLRLHEYLKITNEKLNEKSKFPSDTSLNTPSEPLLSNDNMHQTNEKASSPKQSVMDTSNSDINMRPRSLSASAVSKKEHLEKSTDQKPDKQKITIPESLVKKMKTTEAGFLACSRGVSTQK